jgi:hypothetical protein
MINSLTDEGFVDTVRSLVEFLQTNGFSLTAETLITEVENRITAEPADSHPPAEESQPEADAAEEIDTDTHARHDILHTSHVSVLCTCEHGNLKVCGICCAESQRQTAWMVRAMLLCQAP